MDFNPHPPLTGFPIALLFSALVAECLALSFQRTSFRSFSSGCVIAACIASVATLVSGYFGVDHASKMFLVPAAEIESHETMARVFVLSLVPLLTFSVFRHSSTNPLLNVCFCLCLLISTALVGWVGFLGGDLVFEHGAGVQPDEVVLNPAK